MQELQETGNVVRSPEQEEDGHDGDDEPHDAVLLGSPHAHQSGDDPGVANHHHHHGKHQAQHVGGEEVVMHPALVFRGVVTFRPLVLLRHIEDVRPLVLLRHFEEEERWQGDTEAKHPDERDQDDAHLHGAIPSHAVSMHDDRVAVHRHDDHEEDAAEEARLLGARQEPAHEVPVGPVADHHVVDVEGQREDEEQVGEGQIEEAQVRQVALVPVLHQDTHNEAVPYGGMENRTMAVTPRLNFNRLNF